MQNKSDKKQTKTFSGLIEIPFYPVNYAKVLIQIGHEPLLPFRSTSLLGREKYFYPNVISYLRYIHSVEGITGLYRGLGMRIISNLIGNHVYNYANKFLDEREEKEKANNNNDDDEDETNNFNTLLKQTSRNITTRCCALVFSHPFHVMAIRCMAQFVGGETTYSSWNVFQNATVIYKNEGLPGFFSGLIPRLAFEASTIALTSLIAYTIKTYILSEKEFEIFVDLIASLVASNFTYPLSLVSTVSCVSGCGLLAGQPPKMMVYESWLDAMSSLNENNQLKRGSSLFFRQYSPVQAVKIAPMPVVKLSTKL